MAAGSTYTPIATTTLGSAASSYTFSSIPGTYTDLVLILSTKTSSSGAGVSVRFNGDTGSNYSWTEISGNGSAASSARGTNTTSIFNCGSTSTADFQAGIMSFNNYSNTTTYKTVLSRGQDTTNGYVQSHVGTWRSTAAINSVTVLANSGNLTTGCTFTLYGIAAA